MEQLGVETGLTVRKIDVVFRKPWLPSPLLFIFSHAIITFPVTNSLNHLNTVHFLQLELYLFYRVFKDAVIDRDCRG